MDTCIYKKNHSNQFQGKAGFTYCGKPAAIVDSNGRALCQSHFNKFNAKVKRAEIRRQLFAEKIPYGTFLKSINPQHEHWDLFKNKVIK